MVPARLVIPSRRVKIDLPPKFTQALRGTTKMIPRPCCRCSSAPQDRGQTHTAHANGTFWGASHAPMRQSRRSRLPQDRDCFPWAQPDMASIPHSTGKRNGGESTRPSPLVEWFNDWGGVVVDGVIAVGDFTLFAWRTLVWLFTRLPRRGDAATQLLPGGRA